MFACIRRRQIITANEEFSFQPLLERLEGCCWCNRDWQAVPHPSGSNGESLQNNAKCCSVLLNCYLQFWFSLGFFVFLVDRSWHDNVCLSTMLCIVAKYYISPTAKVSEQVNSSVPTQDHDFTTFNPLHWTWAQRAYAMQRSYRNHASKADFSLKL